MTPTASQLAQILRSVRQQLSVEADPEVLESYRRDQAQFSEAGSPAVVVFARSTEDVASVMRVAYEHHVPVVCRGAGSGLSGGANAVDGCIVLALHGMDKILEINAEDMLAVLQPGVITGDLKTLVGESGLSYPPDPASYTFSTIGGNVATNAGGLCCVRYGVTADYVLGLEVVLADGTVVRTGRRTRKGVAGYDVTRLFVGSEGTLGVITEITLRLVPQMSPRSTLVASFPTLESAGLAVSSITKSMTASMLELLDRTTMNAIESWKPIGLDERAQALLLAQFDADDADAPERMEKACMDAGSDLVITSGSAAEADLLLGARRLAFPSLERQGDVLLDDVAVPIGKVATLLRGIPPIAERCGVLVATFGHVGDGNMHPTIVFDRSNPSSKAAARRAFAEIIDLALKLGGTVTGEHGIGSLKRSFLEAELGAGGLALQRAIKGALDPVGILNPGKAI